MINCIVDSHNDKVASMKIYRKSNNCFCFSCKSNLSPVDVVMEANKVPKHVAAKTLINDFLNGDIYSYSNLREVEQDKNIADRGKFHDIFPLSREDVEFIGLIYDKMFPVYLISELEYDTRMAIGNYNFSSEYERLNIKDKDVYFDENGELKTRQCTHEEMYEMGLVSNPKLEMPSLSEMWERKKITANGKMISEPYRDVVNRRKLIENMLIGKCEEKIALNKTIVAEQEALCVFVNEQFTQSNIWKAIVFFKKHEGEDEKELSPTEQQLMKIATIYSKERNQIEQSMKKAFENYPNISKQEKDDFESKFLSLEYIKISITSKCKETISKAYADIDTATAIKKKVVLHQNERENDYKKWKKKQKK